MQVERFILGGSPSVIRALAEVIEADPALGLIDVGGPAGAPDRLVATMPPERAELFRSALAGQLAVELDVELEITGDEPGPGRSR